MSNTIDKKYMQMPMSDPTEDQIDSIRKAIIGYMTSYTLTSYIREIVTNWSTAYYLFANTDNIDIYRGICFTKENASDYYYLLAKIASSHSITSRTIRSWTASAKVAYRFAYYYEPNTIKVIFKKDGIIAAAVFGSQANSGEGLNLIDASNESYNAKLNKNFVVNEYEVIMPPSTLECSILSAAFLSLSDRIVYLYKPSNSTVNDNVLENQMNELCEKLNADLPEGLKKYKVRTVKTIKRYLSIFRELMM